LKIWGIESQESASGVSEFGQKKRVGEGGSWKGKRTRGPRKRKWPEEQIFGGKEKHF